MEVSFASNVGSRARHSCSFVTGHDLNVETTARRYRLGIGKMRWARTELFFDPTIRPIQFASDLLEAASVEETVRVSVSPYRDETGSYRIS